MSMKILLVRPPSKGAYRVYLPLGLAYIAGRLLQCGHEIHVWDIDAERWPEKDVEKRIRSDIGRYQLVGITAMPGDYSYVKRMSDSLKRASPDIKIIIGGYLGSSLPQFLMEDLAIDFVAVGEGEETMVELAHAMETASDLAHVKGIYFRDGSGQIVSTPARERLKTLDTLPFPPFEIFPMEAYLNGHSFGENHADGIVSIMASRGCPHDCNYCDHTIKGYRPRYRPVRSVIDEIKWHLSAYGDQIRQFYFWDDILIWDKEWTREFCETLLRECPDIRWTCNCHVNRVDAGLMSLMKKAGCINVRFGIESGSQRILDSLNKGVKVEDALQALMICLKAGLDLTIYIMVGMTGESRETVNETLEFFRRLALPVYSYQLKNVNFFMVTPFPGTKIFEKVCNDGLIGDMAEYLTRDCDALYDIPLNISGLTDNDLIVLKRRLEKDVIEILDKSRHQLNDIMFDMAMEMKR